jgi:spore germination protein
MVIHVVRSGESIYTISRLYDVPSSKIISDNELTNPGQLVIGQTIVIMTDRIPHYVRPGQSLYSIALAYKVPLNDLIKANPNINPNRLIPGQVIYIPIPNQKLGTIEVNGYAFPNINRETLSKTLPNLTYLSIFSYEVRPNGTLTTINDTPLIQAARAARVAPIMVITNIEEGGSFSSTLASTILGNEQIQNTLLDNVVEVLRSKNYYGLDIDFEYIFPKDRENYNKFVEKVVNRLRPLGYKVITSLAPKTSATQKGLLYEAHDYPVHGRLVDHVVLMTYEWGYTYGPPMAVAPINEVRKVLDYAVTEIPRNKILMGMPNYGYDWTLPWVRGSTARTISNVGAVNQAAQVGANIAFDITSAAPYYFYYKDGIQHVVWFEDARSVQAKLKLAHEFRLGGVSYWTLGSYFPQNWLVQQTLYDVRKVL